MFLAFWCHKSCLSLSQRMQVVLTSLELISMWITLFSWNSFHSFVLQGLILMVETLSLQKEKSYWLQAHGTFKAVIRTEFSVSIVISNTIICVLVTFNITCTFSLLPWTWYSCSFNLYKKFKRIVFNQKNINFITDKNNIIIKRVWLCY